MGRGFESLQARLSIIDMLIFNMVGIAQLVSAPDCGSGGRGFKSLYSPLVYYQMIADINDGLSPSGKAQDFDSCTRWFESS